MDTSIPAVTSYQHSFTGGAVSQNRIRILPEHLANQIAAGEVVQRPESVVKELVENAIDAGATSITVVIQEGGLRSIQVVDNGSGMSKEDLELSVVRHATSKISTESDLHAIHTLGFRGEALASIAAVADVEIATAMQGQQHGWTLYSRPGQMPICKPVASRVGTSISVLNLFASVPARRKFLKSPLTEFRYISETIQKLAIARPDIRFVLYDGQALVMDVHPGSTIDRIKHVLRNVQEADLLPLDHAEGGVWIKGYVGNQQVVRKNRSGQYLYLNGRSIYSKSLAYAISQCFEHIIPAGQHPLFAIWIDIDPERIDVNIHPQKHEVKFDDERAIFLLVQHTVTTALATANLIPDPSAFLPLAQRPLQSLQGAGQGHVAVNRLTGEILERSLPAPFPSSLGFSQAPTGTQPRMAPAAHGAYVQLMTELPQEHVPSVLFVDRGLAMCRHDDGIMVVRLFAALERVFFEQIQQKRGSGEVSAEQLLFPVTFNLDAADQALIAEHDSLIASFGFDVEIADGVLHVRGIPWFVAAGDEESGIRDVIQSLREVVTMNVSEREEQMMIRLARSRAFSAVHDVSSSHVQQIVKDLRACTISHLSPSGMSTYTVITFDEMEKRLQ